MVARRMREDHCWHALAGLTVQSAVALVTVVKVAVNFKKDEPALIYVFG